ncbi:Probable conserved lipoprotein LpqB [Mycobacteroides abscessus subsp. abscessus]|nr:Probable conserved lipoprotein LpqB [Mycobacteroides abscessus subsp. abscessus]
MTKQAFGARMLRRRAVLAGASVAALAGCARIPNSSEVHTTPVKGIGLGAQGDTAVAPPDPGATKIDIVRGFLAAHLGVEDGNRTAREYLAESIRKSWKPMTGIEFSETEGLVFQELDGDKVSVTVPVVSKVSPTGARAVNLHAEREKAEFRLVQVNGQWRISETPDALVLGSEDFARLFEPVRVYFVANAGDALVADPRWFLRQSTFASAFNRLALGPPQYLKDAVRSALNEGSVIAPSALSRNEAGDLVVQPPASVLELPHGERALALAQISATLLSLKRVPRVVFMDGREEIALPPDSHPVKASVGHRLYGSGDSGIVSLASDTGGASLVPALASETVRLGRISANGRYASAVSLDRRTLLVTDRSADAYVRRESLAEELCAPSIDQFGYAWTMPSVGAPELIAVSADLSVEVRRLPVPWQPTADIAFTSLSSDGVRLAVVHGSRGAITLSIIGIVREKHGAPMDLSEPLNVSVALETVDGIAWYSEESILLWGTSGESTLPMAISWNMHTGFEQVSELRENTTSVAGSLEARLMFVGSGDGQVVQRKVDSWAHIDVRGRDIALY